MGQRRVNRKTWQQDLDTGYWLYIHLFSLLHSLDLTLSCKLDLLLYTLAPPTD